MTRTHRWRTDRGIVAGSTYLDEIERALGHELSSRDCGTIASFTIAITANYLLRAPESGSNCHRIPTTSRPSVINIDARGVHREATRANIVHLLG
ncbi:hypothetical protein [Rhodococcus qingshengii]|uniref:hypothetical protein n=1 Tax=Rhodococcus qingshengii TaxID=334542 RepID=UPI001C605CDC|nr:hypothetical protein [Rhodococcus qingshengii]MBW4818773.1 hypothetical protein [Rhodococcus qingshengii]